MSSPLERISRFHGGHWACVALVALATLLMPSASQAQKRNISVSLLAGSGLSFGGGGGQTQMRHTPLHLDLAVRTWVSESGVNRDPILGAALRVEIEGRASVAIIPRAELARTFGSFELRPYIGVPFFFAPFSLLGAEAGGVFTIKLHGQTRLLINIAADVFFWGSDLPSGQALVAINGGIGFELGTRP